MSITEDNEMPREVNEIQPYTDTLVKLIPTEIVGAYMVIAGMLGFDPTKVTDDEKTMYTTLIQVVFFVLLVLTPLYLWRVSEDNKQNSINRNHNIFRCVGLYATRTLRRLENIRSYSRFNYFGVMVTSYPTYRHHEVPMPPPPRDEDEMF